MISTNFKQTDYTKCSCSAYEINGETIHYSWCKKGKEILRAKRRAHTQAMRVLRAKKQAEATR